MNLRHPRHPRLKKIRKTGRFDFYPPLFLPFWSLSGLFLVSFWSLSGLFLVSFKAYPETKKRKPCDDCE